MHDAIIIGGGVVGLAAAKTLSDADLKVLIVEMESRIGTGTSSRYIAQYVKRHDCMPENNVIILCRNSEIIHSGIYYTPGTLRAKLCVSGKHMLYDYCKEKGIRHKRPGKLLVATDKQQVARLKQFLKVGAENNVELRWLEKEEVAKIEPKLRCTAAIFSPTTGIVDIHRLMQTLLGDAQENGAELVLESKVVGGDIEGQHKKVILENVRTHKRRTVTAKYIVNAAGLSAQTVAQSLGARKAAIPRQYLAKGNYFTLKGKAPFSHLIYPMPNEAGLGTHLTLGLNGEAKFGPDVQYVDKVEYTVDASRAETFYTAIRDYWPALPDDSLQPSFSGIRPKGDFQIDFDSTPGVVHLYGIESPGLTSSMAIGALIKERLLHRGNSISSKL